MINNYIFDLYNTLIDIRTNEHKKEAWTPVVAYFAEHGIHTDTEKLCEEYDSYWKEFENLARTSEYEYPECDCVAQFEYIAERCGGHLSRERAAAALCIMREASTERFGLFPGIAELLERLRARGAKLYILSNAQSVFTVSEIRRAGLDGKFDGVLLSSDCGCRKPDPAFFGMLFDKYKLDKAKSVMIGDDADSDGVGAKRFGIGFIQATGGAAVHGREIEELIDRR